MSYYDYEQSKDIRRHRFTFDALIMAAMFKADTYNAAILQLAFPEIWEELQARYDAPGGKLEGEKE